MCIHPCKSHICKSLWIKASAKSLKVRVKVKMCGSGTVPHFRPGGMRIFPLSRRLADTFPVEGRGPQRISISDLLCYQARKKKKINQEESSRLPSQQIAFSGIQLDSRLMVATPFQQRVNNTLKLISHFRRGRALALKSYLRLLGMLTAASSVVPLG